MAKNRRNVQTDSRNWYFEKCPKLENLAGKSRVQVIEKMVPKFRVLGSEILRKWYFGLSRNPHR